MIKLSINNKDHSLGIEPESPAALRGIEDLPRRFSVLPADAQSVKRYIEATLA